MWIILSLEELSQTFHPRPGNDTTPALSLQDRKLLQVFVTAGLPGSSEIQPHIEQPLHCKEHPRFKSLHYCAFSVTGLTKLSQYQAILSSHLSLMSILLENIGPQNIPRPNASEVVVIHTLLLMTLMRRQNLYNSISEHMQNDLPGKYRCHTHKATCFFDQNRFGRKTKKEEL